MHYDSYDVSGNSVDLEFMKYLEFIDIHIECIYLLWSNKLKLVDLHAT